MELVVRHCGWQRSHRIAFAEQFNMYATPDEAARAALTLANPRSVADNLEYGGNIYFDPATGLYGFTGRGQGSDRAYDPSQNPVPAGCTEVGVYHCHGDYSVQVNGKAVRTSDPARDDFNSDNFSAPDRRYFNERCKQRPGYIGYLGTPSGAFRRYDTSDKSDKPF
jgi:hypothetical protein